MPAYSEANVPNQTGKTVFITGANTGIGFATARVLAQRGARVILGCRSEAKAAATKAKIEEQISNANIALVPIDLADLASVRNAAHELQQESELQLLINNAGIMMPPRELTADGFESQFGVNHLAHFALTGLLLPQLLAQPQARIVTVSSTAHRSGIIAHEDLDAQRSYAPFGRYAMSKLANLLFTFELQRRFSAGGHATMALACHPGGADTELGRHMPGWVTSLISPLARLMLNSSAEGALPTLRAATDPEAQGGDYYGPAGLFELANSAAKVEPNALSRNTVEAQRLWDASVDLTGVNPAL